jgi:hypothetical protein
MFVDRHEMQPLTWEDVALRFGYLWPCVTTIPVKNVRESNLLAVLALFAKTIARTNKENPEMMAREIEELMHSGSKADIENWLKQAVVALSINGYQPV